MTAEQAIKPNPEKLIELFKSLNKKKPVKPGTWVYHGETEFDLGDMGYRNANQDTLSDSELIEQIKWNIAHQNYAMLKRCIGIDGVYDIKREILPYSIDIYGDGKTVEYGELYISVSDYHMLYSRLDKTACKKAIVSRIALANVGLFVPYITVKNLTLIQREDKPNNPNVKVKYTYIV